MSKIRSDSAWGKLTPEQRETLEEWLFEENVGYREALERAQKEFGVTASLTSLAEYYQRRAQERAPNELAGLKAMVEEIENSRISREDLTEAAMMLVAKRMVQLAVESPGKVKELAALGRLLVADGAQGVRRDWLEIEQDRIHRELGKEAAFKERMATMLGEAFLQKPGKKTEAQNPNGKDGGVP